MGGRRTGPSLPGSGMKRTFDLLVSAVGLILLAPVMLVIVWLVSRSSPGGALFVQARVGRSEKLFACYKFRTMAQGAPVAGSHEVSGSWITPVGLGHCPRSFPGGR